jgi:hypothetical protein
MADPAWTEFVVMVLSGLGGVALGALIVAWWQR